MMIVKAYRPTLSPTLVTPSLALSSVDLLLSGVIFSAASVSMSALIHGIGSGGGEVLLSETSLRPVSIVKWLLVVLRLFGFV
jgi:hypothetical protein